MSTKLGNHITPQQPRATKSAKGKTDWAKLSQLRDADINITADAPSTKPEDWINAIAHRGIVLPQRKEQIALRVDADVLSWFRDQGAGWQTRMNAVLKAYCDTLSEQAVKKISRPATQRRAGKA